MKIQKLPWKDKPEPHASDVLAEALKSIVRSVICEELSVLRADLANPPSEYRGRNEEAQRLGISVATLDRLCREGMPFVYVGESRRFRSTMVDSWLSAREPRLRGHDRESG